MNTRQVDIAIIGAGTAGLNAVREAEKSGRSWLLIDHGPYGTTCARVGCMPSKLLIAAADVAHQARSAGEFGVRVPDVAVDGRAVMARVRRERDRFAGGVVKDTEALPRESRLRGQARFVGPAALEVQPRGPQDDPPTRVEAGAVVVATGSSSLVPPPFDVVRDRVLTNENVFELDDLPRSMAVIGAGILGIELGQALARLGVEVTFLDRAANIGPCTDPEVLSHVNRELEGELTMRLETEVTAATPVADGVALTWQRKGDGEQRGVFEKLLVAVGRPPNLKALNLEATGLPLDDEGRPPWNSRTTQCGDLPVFLAGDVDGFRPLLHEAGDEGRIAGANAASWPEVEAHERRTPLTVVFSDPQMAMVGTSFRELDPESTRIGQVDFRHQGRARVMVVNRGLLRVYARSSDRVLVGAEMFGPRVEHLAHLLAWAVQEETPVQHLLRVPVYHPTLEEGMRTALRDLARALDAESECRSEDLSTSPGM